MSSSNTDKTVLSGGDYDEKQVDKKVRLLTKTPADFTSPPDTLLSIYNLLTTNGTITNVNGNGYRIDTISPPTSVPQQPSGTSPIFIRSLVFNGVERDQSVVINPSSTGGNPQLLLTVSTRYTSKIAPNGMYTIDEAQGYWSFDYTSNDNILAYYLEANYHGVCILYSGKLTAIDGVDNAYVAVMSANEVDNTPPNSVSIIQNEFLRQTNTNVTWFFNAFFDIANKKIVYSRISKHSANIYIDLSSAISK